MTNDMEFFFYWQEVRDRFMPIVEQQKKMWEKAKRTDNIEQIESELKPCILKITSYDEAKEFLMVCKEQERISQPSVLSGLKSLFTELKNIIFAVAKDSPGIPKDYLEFVSKQISPRSNATIDNSRWAKLKESSSGSDNDNQDTATANESKDITNDKTDFIPRSIPTKEVRPNIVVHNPAIKGMTLKM